MMSSVPSGASLSPASLSSSVISEGVIEGSRYGAMVFPFSFGATYFTAIRKSGFLHKQTNVSSRTALVIMPPFFAWCLVSELAINGRKKDNAQQLQELQNKGELQQSDGIVTQRALKPLDRSLKSYTDLNGNNYRVVPELSFFQATTNYVADHPFKALIGVGVPTVGSIFFYQQKLTNPNYDLKFSQRVMHARVFGQFSALLILMGVMGLREIVDWRGGKFMSHAERER